MVECASFTKEREILAGQEKIIIGIDEAGRGPLAGPVVAAAAVLRNPHDREVGTSTDVLWDFVRDSKTLSEKKREELYTFVHEKFIIGVGLARSDVVDRMNILQATFFAMKIALTDLTKAMGKEMSLQESIILVDGNQKIPNISRAQICISSGDRIVKSIAAASIIAKVTRDRMMHDYDAMYPVYGFAKHKGYGTKQHMEALRTHGACLIHRTSFAPVKKVL